MPDGIKRYQVTSKPSGKKVSGKDGDHSKRKVEKEYCQGYLDKHGQWNNGFYCIKFTKKPNTKFCCGDQFSRFCCKQSTIGTTPHDGPHLLTTTVVQTVQSSSETDTLDIPLIAGVAAGGAVVLLLFIVLCCCICPCCPNKRRQKQRTKKTKAQESREVMQEPDLIARDRDGTISDSDTVSTAMYPVSPTPTSQTSLPSSNSTHDSRSHHGEPLLMTGQTRLTQYKGGVMVSAMPTYIHEDIHGHPDTIVHTMKPITFGQLKNRFPDIYPNEEIDPYTLTSGLGQDFSGQTFTNISHGRLLRPNLTGQPYHSPNSNLRAHMHTNPYAL